MQRRDAYIVATGAFLPGNPIDNEGAEQILGSISRFGSKARRIVQRNNGIQQRHYALDPQTRQPTHTNAQLTAQAIRSLGHIPRNPSASRHAASLQAVDLLSCGTSSPDQMIPAHASMVQGELGMGPCAVNTAAGVCLSGINALKLAHLSVMCGDIDRAIVAGSEMVSAHLRKERYETTEASRSHPLRPHPLETEEGLERLIAEPEIGFANEFLRWSLSDGAGACLVDHVPAREGLSLRIDWIDLFSYAHELPTCMYMGAVCDENNSLRGWPSFFSLGEAAQSGALLCGQDAKLLARNIVTTCIDAALGAVAKRRALETSKCAWLLPHYSSEFFRADLHDGMERIGCGIPYERWFTNLTRCGNTGSASIFVMLDELCRSGRLEVGQSILCFVPESARFSVGWMHLTVVG
jgi:3-oxoacyl-[acyl-carrier-protein] synthase-3